MSWFYYLVPALLISFLLRETEKNSYKNVYAAITALIAGAVSVVAVLVLESLQVSWQYEPIVLLFLPVAATIVCKLFVRSLSKSDGYFIPYRYINGFPAKVIEHYYQRSNMSFYLRERYHFTRNLLFFAALLEYAFGIWLIRNSLYPSELLLTAIGVLVTVFFEYALFLTGSTLLSREENKYLQTMRRGVSSRKLFQANYESPDDYEYLFRRINMTEKPHLIHATIHNHCRRSESKTRLYDFDSNTYSEFTDEIQNDQLNVFLRKNGLQPNPQCVQAFTLLDRNYNVLLKASSYIDFDPYLAALIKKKSVETYRTIVVVDTATSADGFIKRYNRVFREYFGMPAIPVIRRFSDVLRNEYSPKEEKKGDQHGINAIYGEVFADSKEDFYEDAPTKTDVIVVTPEDILGSDNADALRRFSADINFLIYYDFSECVHEETLLCKIVHSVLDAEDRVSTLYMTDGFFDFKQAISNFFSTRPFYEVVISRDLFQKSYCTVWKYENAEEIQERSITNPAVDFGMHPVLAVFGERYLNNNCMLIADETDTYKETFSNFASSTNAASRVDCFVGWKDIIEGNYVYCSVTDRYNNIPHTYRAIQGIGMKCEYINIVSKPYLLREYLAYFSKFLSCEPDALTTFSAAMLNSPRVCALECVIKSFLIGCTEEEVRAVAEKAGIGAQEKDADTLVSLAKETHLLKNEEMDKIAKSGRLVEQRDGKLFICKLLYDAIVERTEFTKKLYFSVNDQQIVRYQKDFRYLVPGQSIALDGRKYTVTDSVGDTVSLSDSLERESMYSTRIVRRCCASEARSVSVEQIAPHHQKTTMEITNYICKMKIDIHGRICFKNAYSFNESMQLNNYRYHCGNRIISREYDETNMLRIKFKSKQFVDGENRATIARLTALLIKEMLPTFFPRNSDRIVVACSEWSGEIPKDSGAVNLNYIVAPLELQGEALSENCAENEFCLYLFEDSAIETGVANVFWQTQELLYMFRILEDYLYYLEVIDRETREWLFGHQYDELLHQLRKMLLLLVDAPQGESDNVQYQNRIRNIRDTFNEKRLINHYNMICDFCGKPIRHNNSEQPYVFYHYSGKQSCAQCAASAVSTDNYGQVAICENAVKRWVAKKYKTTIIGPSFNSLEDAEFINKSVHPNELYPITDDREYGVVGYNRWTTTKVDVLSYAFDAQRMLRIVEGTSGERKQEDTGDVEDYVRSGYFTDNGNVILIENGLPRFKYESTLAHELTHQWQFEQLDQLLLHAESIPITPRDEFDFPVDLFNFREEGHASWVEWTYLKTHGHRREAAELKRSLINRSDEYGFGFRWFRDLMRVGGRDIYSHIERSPVFKMRLLKYQMQKNPYAVMQLFYGKTPPADDAGENTEQQENA